MVFNTALCNLPIWFPIRINSVDLQYFVQLVLLVSNTFVLLVSNLGESVGTAPAQWGTEGPQVGRRARGKAIKYHRIDALKLAFFKTCLITLLVLCKCKISKCQFLQKLLENSVISALNGVQDVSWNVLFICKRARGTELKLEINLQATKNHE